MTSSIVTTVNYRGSSQCLGTSQLTQHFESDKEIVREQIIFFILYFIITFPLSSLIPRRTNSKIKNFSFCHETCNYFSVDSPSAGVDIMHWESYCILMRLRCRSISSHDMYLGTWGFRHRSIKHNGEDRHSYITRCRLVNSKKKNRPLDTEDGGNILLRKVATASHLQSTRYKIPKQLNFKQSHCGKLKSLTTPPYFLSVDSTKLISH